MQDLVTIGCIVGMTLALALSAWLYRCNLQLVDQLTLEVRNVVTLQGAVAEAREVFFRYEQMHLAKKSAEGDKKAFSNREYAEVMDKALKDTRYPEPGPLQQVILNTGRALKRARDRMAGETLWDETLETQRSTRG